MPKIDWVDDSSNENQPRWEARRRERGPRETRDRRARLEQIIAMAATPPALAEPPIRRPLHLIWGRPQWDAEAGGDRDLRPPQAE